MTAIESRSKTGQSTMHDIPAVSPCVMPHKRIPVKGEAYSAGGVEMIGDGVAAVWDRSGDGGRVVAAAHDGALLCKGHLHRLTELIASTPRVVEWIRMQIEPTNSQADRSAGYTKPSKKEPPLPVSAAAIDAADEELEVLSEWVRQVAEDRREPLPDLPGARVRWRSSLRTNPSEVYSTLTAAEQRALMPMTVVAGFRSGDSDLAGYAVNSLTRYLLLRIEWIAKQPWVEDMLTELAGFRLQHLARWPIGDTARRVRGFRCMTCQRESIVVHPPAKAPLYIEQAEMWTRPVPGGIGPVSLPEPRPVLDWRGAQVRLDDGTPRVHASRETNYAYPMLVACSDKRCGATVDETYWEWARQVAESGRDMRDDDIKLRAKGKTSGPSDFDGNGW